MFDELAKRLESEISKMPVIDPHTHLQHRSPSAKFIGNIFSYHYIRMELSTVGMDVASLMNDSIPPDERMKNALPYIPRIMNTTTWWGFMEICKALGFTDPYIDASNIDRLCDIASRTMSSENWYRKALDDINVKRSFLTNLPDEDMSGCDMEYFSPSLRVDEWVTEIHDPNTRHKLENLTDSTITDIQALFDAIRNVTKKFINIKAVSMAISLPSEFRAFPVSKIDAEDIFAKVLKNKRLTDDEYARLQSYILYGLFEMCEEFRLPFQIMLGVNRKIHKQLEWDGFSTDMEMLKTFRDALNRFPNVKFVFSILNTVLSHELAIYAKTFANCYVAGHWWYTFYPDIIKRMVIERLHAVPYPKLVGWYSDSYYVEWTIAKIKLYIRALSTALSSIVQEGFMSEEMALKVAKAMLWDNNIEIFRLN